MENGQLKLTAREQKLIQFLREMGWGQVRIKVKDGEPVLGTFALQDVKFD
jgi:hypothetical protein